MTADRHGRLATNFRWLVISYVATKVTGFATVFLLARSLGDDLFGRFAIALAIPLSLEALADLGLAWALIREGAGRAEFARRLAYAALGPKIVLAGVSVAVSYLIAKAAGMPAEVVDATLFLAIAKGADSLTYLCRAVFQAHERMDYDAAALTFDGALRLVLVVYAIAGDFGLVGFAKAYAVSAMIVLLSTGLFCFRRLMRPPAWDLTLLPYLFSAGLPLGLVWLLDGVGTRVGIVVLGARLGDAAAGNFAAAMRLVEPLVAIPGLMSTALLPLATRHLLEERATMAWLFEASLKVAMIVAVASTLILLGLGRSIVGMVFGESFMDAREIIGLMALSLVPLFVHGLLFSILVALRRQRSFIVAQAVGIAVNVGLLLALPPSLGPASGAIALLLAELSIVVAAFALVPELRSIRFGSLARLLAYAGTASTLLLTGPVIGPLPATLAALAVLTALIRHGQVIASREIVYLESTSPLLGRVGRMLVPP